MGNINYNTKLLYDNIFDSINNSGLPIATAYFVVKDLFRDLEIAYQQVYNQEAASENGATQPSGSSDPDTPPAPIKGEEENDE